MVTNYYLNVIAGNVFHTKTTPALPAKLYIGFSTTDTKDTVTEPVGNGYARVEVTALSEPANGVVSNTADIKSPRATADWGVLTHYAIYDAATEGNLLIHDALNHPRHGDIDTLIIFEAGELKLCVQNPVVQEPVVPEPSV